MSQVSVAAAMAHPGVASDTGVVPAGNGSSRTTSSASAGPALETVIVKVTAHPRDHRGRVDRLRDVQLGLPGDRRDDRGVRVVGEVGSKTLGASRGDVATFSNRPSSSTVATIVRIAWAGGSPRPSPGRSTGGSSPTDQTPVAGSYEPMLAVADTNVSPAGRRSSTITGPRRPGRSSRADAECRPDRRRRRAGSSTPLDTTMSAAGTKRSASSMLFSRSGRPDRRPARLPRCDATRVAAPR